MNADSDYSTTKPHKWNNKTATTPNFLPAMHVFVTGVPSAAGAVVDRYGTLDISSKTNISGYHQMRIIAFVQLVCIFKLLTTKMQININLTFTLESTSRWK